ncbi:acyl carrier protein [Flavobacterium sp.]|jgi:acyl carrier protein|uniref:acyl carrier protein n=1 Tax=Flavobacterium sp. TaxID=239 RepID=UPI0037842399
MSVSEKYNSVFVSVFNVEESVLGNDFSAENIDNWDSITQLSLVTAIEDEFDIMFDPEDILNFKSYSVGKTIVAKYGVNF